MKTNFSVLFFLKKPKNYKVGAACFIYLRITVDGVRAEMATSRSCEPERGNANAGSKWYQRRCKDLKQLSG